MSYIADNISTQGIEKLLKNPFNIRVFDEVTSTNALIKEEALKGANEGLVIIAERQTMGKGRFSRKFYSPQHCGIYMTVLLKPTLPPTDSVLITAAAAVAVSRAIEALSDKKADIKWVNDVLINSKKVCGILTEGSVDTKSGNFCWAALGIGINAYSPTGGFHEEIKDIAGSVFDKRKENLRNSLIAKVLDNFWEYYKNLLSRSFYNDYKNRICTIGKEITVIKNNEIIGKAKCLDLDKDCRLLVEYQNGESEYLSSGEISIKQKG